MIRLGGNYNRYFNSVSYNTTKLNEKRSDNIKEVYLVENKPNQQIYRGKLYVFKNGSAMLKVNYVSYSGVKNKYELYFDTNGNEIIDSNNNTKKEKEYFDLLKTDCLWQF